MNPASILTGVLQFVLALSCGAALMGVVRAGRRRQVLARVAAAPAREAGFSSRVTRTRLVRLPRPSRSRRRNDAEIGRALPAAVEGIARSLRAGGSVRTALAEAAAGAPSPLRHDLGRVVRAGDSGIPLRQAFERWADERPLPDVRLTVAALALGADAGVGLARSLDGVAATLYERAAIEQEVRALSTQARYSAGVLAIAPLIFLAVVGFLEPATMSFLVGSPAGLACLGVGVGLDAVGGWWMARITRRAT